MLTFVVLNAAAGIVALLAARVAAGPRARTSFLVLAGLSGYLLVVHAAMLGAGLVGWLTVGGVSIALVILLAASGGSLWRAAARASARPPGPEPGREVREAGGAAVAAGVRERDPPACTAAERFAPLVAVTVGVVWAWPHLFEATRLWIWDDYTYHMVYPALWLREHAIAAPSPAHAFTMQAWYPLSASVVASWFMLPLASARGDALAWVSLTGLLYAAIVASATIELLARLGCRRGAWAVPVVLMLASHRVAIMASSFSDADLAHAAALFAALAFAVPRGHREGRDADHGTHDTDRDVGPDTWYAALLTGLAIGVKVSAAPVALIVLAAMVARRAGWPPGPGARPGGWRAGLGTVGAFAIAWSATGAYWYARNWWHTDNPVYPAAFLWAPGETFPHTTLREYAAHYGLTRAVRDALAVYLDWPLPHAVLAVAGLAGLAVIARARIRARRFFAITALVATVTVLLVLPSAPYSAGNGMTFVSGFIHWDSMRYVALLPLLGWAALGVVLDAGRGAARWRTVVAITVTSGAVLTSGLPRRETLAILGVAIVAAFAASRIARWNRPGGACPRAGGGAGGHARVGWGRRMVVCAAIVGVAVIVTTSHGAKARATAAAIHREPLFGQAAAVVDREPPGTRVAVFGDQWIYPVFGERGHLHPVRLDGDGRIASAPIGGAMTPGPLAVAAATFGANLREAGVGIVVIVHMPHPGRDPAWPTQHAALQGVAGASRVYEDGGASVWQLDTAPRRRP